MSSRNKKILVIAHHFPPMGGPGTHRSLQFVKNLYQFGYLPVVLTITLDDIKKSPYPADESLLNIVPENLEIHRISTKIPEKFIKVTTKLKIFRLFWFFFYPLFWEQSALWPYNSIKKAKQIIRENNIGIIYTSSGPFSSLLLGYLLKKKCKVKWIADLRDPFTDGYMWQWPGKIQWYMSKLFERCMFKQVDKLIVNTNDVKQLYLKRNIISPEKITVITNGF